MIVPPDPAPAPRLTVRVITAPHDAVLISVESHDADAHRGGLIRLTPAAAAELPRALEAAIRAHHLDVAA